MVAEDSVRDGRPGTDIDCLGAETIYPGPKHPHTLTEVVLPGMDGLELTARVRERCSDLPVLYMVGEDQLSDTVRQGVTDTRNAYLMKPFDDDYLLLKVQAALQG